ncbi:MAG TPA: hypothetical protein VHF05_00200 [Candidatus Paceibacterota bacterium]|jgi:hypothetical protein|nr:hypothetical protein [Candidatus Paceibacterota bacterium]
MNIHIAYARGENPQEESPACRVALGLLEDEFVLTGIYLQLGLRERSEEGIRNFFKNAALRAGLTPAEAERFSQRFSVIEPEISFKVPPVDPVGPLVMSRTA